jgi:predicted RecA/RadA family phage recombinase
MKNFIQCGDTINWTNSTGSAVASGDVVVVGSLVGIALVDIADTATGTLQIEGVFQVAKTTGTAYAQGDELFWDTSGKKTTKTATDKPIGTAHEAALSGDTTTLVKLYGRGNGIPVATLVAQVAGTLTGTVDGTLANVADIACAGGSTPSATNVNTAVNGAILDINLQLKELQTSLNAALTALKNAGLMASS